MKIVLVDATGRESVADILVYEHLHPWVAAWMVNAMQDAAAKDQANTIMWPITKEDDQPLWRGLEELI